MNTIYVKWAWNKGVIHKEITLQGKEVGYVYEPDENMVRVFANEPDGIRQTFVLPKDDILEMRIAYIGSKDLSQLPLFEGLEKD